MTTAKKLQAEDDKLLEAAVHWWRRYGCMRKSKPKYQRCNDPECADCRARPSVWKSEVIRSSSYLPDEGPLVMLRDHSGGRALASVDQYGMPSYPVLALFKWKRGRLIPLLVTTAGAAMDAVWPSKGATR